MRFEDIDLLPIGEMDKQMIRKYFDMFHGDKPAPEEGRPKRTRVRFKSSLHEIIRTKEQADRFMSLLEAASPKGESAHAFLFKNQ